MTYEDLLVAIDTAAPELTNGALRLLLRLISLAIQQGANQVRASDRWLGGQIKLSNKGMTAAKRSIANLVTVESSAGVVTTFTLPGSWFTPQRSLFAADSALLKRAQCTPGEGNGALLERAPVPSLRVHTALPGSAQCTPGEGDCTPGEGAVHSWGGRSALLERAPTTQNQRDTGTLRESNSNSEVTSSLKELVFSILSTRQLQISQRQEAVVLSEEIRHFMRMYGDPETSKNPPDERILAQSLAIAPLSDLLPAMSWAKLQGGRPKTYAWFVSCFLERVKGVPRAVTKQLRDELRERRGRKPVERETSLPFPDDFARRAAAGVKSMH